MFNVYPRNLHVPYTTQRMVKRGNLAVFALFGMAFLFSTPSAAEPPETNPSMKPFGFALHGSDTMQHPTSRVRSKRKGSYVKGNYDASDTQSRHQLFFGVGSLGWNAGYGFALNRTLSFSAQGYRLQSPTLHQEINPSSNGKLYDVRFRMLGLRLNAHIHPFPFKWLHLSGGFGFEPPGNQNRIEALLPSGTYPFGTSSLPLKSDIRYNIEFSPFYPTLSFGGGFTNKAGWGIFVELGIMFREMYAVNNPVFDSSYLQPQDWCGYYSDGSWIHCDSETAQQDGFAGLQTWFDAGDYYQEFSQLERDRVQNHFSPYTLFPILQIGVGYAF